MFSRMSYYSEYGLVPPQSFVFPFPFSLFQKEPSMTWTTHTHANPADLAAAVADRIAGSLDEALASGGASDR